MFSAIREGHDPVNSGADHVRNLRYAEAVYEATRENAVVALDT